MRTFNSMQEFNDMLKAIGRLSTFNQTLSNFSNTVGGLSGGCGCNRAQRAQAARNLYLTMGQILTEDEKTEIKQKLSAERIQLTENGAMFAVF